MPVFEHQYRGDANGPDGQKMRLPNHAALQRTGPILQVVISPTRQHLDSLAENNKAIPQPVSGFALIDTGATSTAVDESVCRELNISPTGAARTAHAGGSEIRQCYPIQVSFPGSGLPSTVIPTAMSVNLQFGKKPYVLLLGRDLLSRLRLVYNGPMGRIEVAF